VLNFGEFGFKVGPFFFGYEYSVSTPIGNGSLSLAKLPSWIEVENRTFFDLKHSGTNP
jgi:hypothetical protein